MIKLNLGCGTNKKAGYVNVDREGDPDVKWNLEEFPWPWADCSVSEIQIVHILEHLGRDPEVYKRIWQELYRICTPGAKLHIVVPHWRHDNFWADPTHVRVVTPLGLCLLSKNFNKACERANASNSPLANYWGVDFEVDKVTYVPSKIWHKMHPNGTEGDVLMDSSEIYCNLVEEISINMRVVKCWPSVR